MLFVTGAVQIPCKKITRQLFLRTDLPDPAKHGGAGASGRGLYSELHKDRSDRWFTWKLRISNRLWLHPKGYHEKNHYFFSEKEETGKVTQKKILLKSMRALEFQCPLKFRCQTRVPVSASPTPVFCASASPVQYGMPSFICRAAALLFAAVTPSLCKYAAVLPTV